MMVFRCLSIATALAACQGKPETAASSEEILAARTLGLAYLQSNQFVQAESAFRQVVIMAPAQALGYANLGLVYLRQGQYPDALEELRRAATLDTASDDIALMLARAEELNGSPDDGRRILAKVLARNPGEIRALYAAKQLAPPDSAGHYLGRILAEAPTNLAARLELVDLLLGRESREAADSAVILLEGLEQLPPLPAEARQPFRTALELSRRGRQEPALLPRAAAAARELHQIMELTAGYQAGLQHLESARGAAIGYPVLSFNPNLAPPALEPDAVASAIRFSDAGNQSAIAMVQPGDGPAIAAADYDGDGAPDLFAGGHLLRNSGPLIEMTDSVGLRIPRPVTAAAFGDYDNDRKLDLYVTAQGRGFLLRNEGHRFRDVTGELGLSDAPAATVILFADLDHDGDLDLVLATDHGLRVYRNPLEGPFQDATAQMGFSGASPVGELAFLDFDHDARIDLVTGGDRLTLWHNMGQGRFEDATASAGLAAMTGTSAIAVGDYDNDGSSDLFLAAAGQSGLYRARNGRFELDRNAGLRSGAAESSASFLDFDNDGFLDLVVTGPGGTRLLRNDGRGRFTDRSASLPGDLGHPGRILTIDYDRDGDLDLLVSGSGPAASRLLFNQGGNANQYVEVQLTALGAGSGKNNAFGIGATLELRAGTEYQSRLVTGPITHFGLGRRLKADVLRIRWPNGVPQTLYYPGALDDVLELQVLKGSCPTLFGWDGTAFRFVTDVMWRSALGMPLGIMGSAESITSASPHASREYLRIPGEALKPRDGRYELRLTEELWEAGYLDRLELLAVDHPDSTEAYVDERFFPPTREEATLRLYSVAQPRFPTRALSISDGRQTELGDLLRHRDDRFVRPGDPDRYQGLRTAHDLILDFGALPRNDSLYLFLTGWIYPTDASINLALTQGTSLAPMPIALETKNAHGAWVTLSPDIGFPSGKNKTVIADLTGRVPRGGEVRLRTNMQVYWDQVFVAPLAPVTPHITRLDPGGATLRYHGFSRTYPKDGHTGPAWFDYERAAPEPAWEPLEGRFTRYGDVLPLLLASDDRYVVFGPGDEIALSFPAAALPELPSGWRRDFLIYTDAWMKDADLNTATGNSVGPLPFHGMTRYPYGAEQAFPSDALHRRFVEQYLSREDPRLRSRR